MRVSERVEPAAFTEMDAIGGDCENLWIKLFESQLSQIFCGRQLGPRRSIDAARRDACVSLSSCQKEKRKHPEPRAVTTVAARNREEAAGAAGWDAGGGGRSASPASDATTINWAGYRRLSTSLGW